MNDPNTILPSPAYDNRVTVIAKARPASASRRSNYPYYKEYYALQLKPAIDTQIQSKSTIIFRYSVYCEGPEKISPTSLYNKINQCIRFLCDFLDNDGKYEQWRKETDIFRSPERGGVIIEYIPEIRGVKTPEMKADSIDTIEEKPYPKWKRKIDDYLEGDDITPLVLTKLALSKEETETLEKELGELKGIEYSIEESIVKIVKI
jgi:hypothetical protein